METKESIENKLKPIFNNYKNDKSFLGEVASRGYVFCEPEHKDLLCIGINPSYIEGDRTNSYSYKLNEAIKAYPKHYGRFDSLANKSLFNDRWSYIDLLALRETDQAKVNKLIETDTGLRFVTKQLEVSQDLIEALKPKVILIANSTASRFFGASQEKDNNIWMGYQTNFDEGYGVEVITGIHPNNISGIKVTKLIGVPVIYSSTLTYMSNHNNKRISWILRRVAKNYSFFFGEKYNHHNSLGKLLAKTTSLVDQIERNLEHKKKFQKEKRYEELSTTHDAEKRLIENLNALLDEYKRSFPLT